MVGGATLTGLLELRSSLWSGDWSWLSQFYVTRRKIPSCVFPNGEYGEKDICIGVPVVIGRSGWEKIINLRLSNDEKKLSKHLLKWFGR
jgi:malate dehydrogenase